MKSRNKKITHEEIWNRKIQVKKWIRDGIQNVSCGGGVKYYSVETKKREDAELMDRIRDVLVAW